MGVYGGGNYGTGLYGATAALTATAQDVWPARVLLTITGLAVGSTVAVYRSVGGERTAVRSAAVDETVDVSVVRVDAEQPYGVPVTYIAVLEGEAEVTDGPDTYTLDGGKVAATDAISGASAEVVILAWDEKTYDRQASVFKVGGRNVVISNEWGQYTSTLELFVESTTQRDNLADLLAGATSGTILVRNPGGYDGVDAYLAVLGATERRFSQDGSDDRRVWALQVAETEAWPAELEARGFTLQDIADAYDGLTLDDLENDFATILLVAQGDFS